MTLLFIKSILQHDWYTLGVKLGYQALAWVFVLFACFIDLKTGITAYGLNEVLTIYRRPVKSLSSNKAAAARRIWNLYRNVAELGVIASACYFAGWAIRATLRRI